MNKELENIIISKYKSGLNGVELSKEIQMPLHSIYKILKKNNITRNASEAQQKYEIIDQDYFKEINSHEKSYFLGLLFADGCIGFSYRNTKDKPRKIFYFNIVSSKEFLASIRDIFINQLNLKENKLVKKHKQDNNIYSLSYSSKNDIIKIRDFLYKDSLLFLNRKKVIFYSM